MMVANKEAPPYLRAGANIDVLSYDHFALGCQSPSAAPVGSMMIENEPAFGTSVTSRMTWAPSDFALAVAAVTSSTSA